MTAVGILVTDFCKALVCALLERHVTQPSQRCAGKRTVDCLQM
jgi:hypothetical protein